MTFTFLGTASGLPSGHRCHASTLVTGTGGNLLLDCGANVAMFLKQQKTEADFLDGIWLSHAHSDHIGGFSNLIQALWLQKRKRVLKVYAPQSLTEILQEELNKRLLFSSLIGFSLSWQAIQENTIFSCGAFALSGFATRHLDSLKKELGNNFAKACFECYGAIWEGDGKRWVYSADLSAPEDLDEVWSKPVEGLICELAHFSPEKLFDYLKNKPLKYLCLTHYDDDWSEQSNKLRKLALDHGISAEVRLVKDHEILKV